ncbi:MAG: polysaccharide deacetylase family protein [Kofleriaceae bacterium]|nr:polysaccharide deacetylase family protein [Kofleriaceae bacterium]
MVFAVALAGCDVTLSEIDNIYSRGRDGPVMCGMSVDYKNTVSNDAIANGLDRAQVDGTIVHLYSHRPAGTVDVSTIEHIIAGAADRDLPFVTYRQLADGDASTGLAFSFDDHNIASWHELIPLFELYGARVTFFISSYHGLELDERAKLHELAAAGHDIEYHSTNHRDAEVVTAEQGIEAYLAEEIIPDFELMRAEGFDLKVFAYPFGSRTGKTDAALLERFALLRGSSHDCPR